jgi:hypothetical protein
VSWAMTLVQPAPGKRITDAREHTNAKPTAIPLIPPFKVAL